MDISMGFTMHIILTFGSMGFAMLTSMGFAMPSWHSWCTMYTEHFSSLDLSTVSKWLHHCCSHPPPVPHPPQLPFVLSPPTICNLLKFRPVPPSFVDHGPNLGNYISDWALAQNGQNPGWAPENNPYLGNGKYLARQIFTLFLQTVSVHLFQVIIW